MKGAPSQKGSSNSGASFILSRVPTNQCTHKNRIRKTRTCDHVNRNDKLREREQSISHLLDWPLKVPVRGTFAPIFGFWPSLKKTQKKKNYTRSASPKSFADLITLLTRPLGTAISCVFFSARYGCPIHNLTKNIPKNAARFERQHPSVHCCCSFKDECNAQR